MKSRLNFSADVNPHTGAERGEKFWNLFIVLYVHFSANGTRDNTGTNIVDIYSKAKILRTVSSPTRGNNFGIFMLHRGRKRA
jgi:hypothetical protein